MRIDGATQTIAPQPQQPKTPAEGTPATPVDSVSSAPKEQLGLIPRSLDNLGHGLAKVGAENMTIVGVALGVINSGLRHDGFFSTALNVACAGYLGNRAGTVTAGKEAQAGAKFTSIATGFAAIEASMHFAHSLGISRTVGAFAAVPLYLVTSHLLDRQADKAIAYHEAQAK